MEWRRTRAVGRRCGSGLCPAPAIGKDQVYAITRAGLIRCAPCAVQIEPQPDVIEDDPAAATVPDGVTHQASLAYGSAR